MTSAQVVETSVTTTDNNPSQVYTITCYPRVQTIYWITGLILSHIEIYSFRIVVELSKNLQRVQESIEGYKTIQQLVKNYHHKYCEHSFN